LRRRLRLLPRVVPRESHTKQISLIAATSNIAAIFDRLLLGLSGPIALGAPDDVARRAEHGGAILRARLESALPPQLDHQNQERRPEKRVHGAEERPHWSAGFVGSTLPSTSKADSITVKEEVSTRPPAFKRPMTRW
jgi:hypothetical protein